MRFDSTLARIPATALLGWVERTTDRRAVPPGAALGSNHVFILPTRFGLLATLAVLAMLLVALNYQNSLAFMLTFLLGALGLVAMVACHRQLRGLGIDTIAAAPVFAGEPILLRLQVRNPGRGMRYGLHLSRAGNSGPAVAAAPGSPALLTLRLPPRARGRHLLRGVELASSEPFATFRAWSRLRQRVELVVYPRPVAAAPPPPGAGGEFGPGAASAAEPEDFAGLARYRPGDRPGQIAWNAYARSGELHRKAFAAHRGGAMWLDLADAPGGDDETRLAVLARWLLDAAPLGAAWGLRLPGCEIGPARGGAHLARCLRALALYPGPYDAR